MTQLVYFNGLLRREDEVFVSLLDRAYLYGEGLFETMRAAQGFIPFLDEHLQRLFRGMEVLKMDLGISGAKLEFALYQTLHHNRLKNAYLRLTLSRENLEFGNFEPSENTNLIVVARPLPRVPQRLYSEGASARVSERIKVSPDLLCQIKTTDYLRHLTVQREARETGADEGLLLNSFGRLAEGGTMNLFVRNAGRWRTPPLSEGVLAGITRQVLLELMEKNRIPGEEAPLELADLLNAEEAFLCNSIKEVVPLTRVDDRPIAGGQVGAETQRLSQLYKEEVQFRLEKFESRRWGVKDSV